MQCEAGTELHKQFAVSPCKEHFSGTLRTKYFRNYFSPFQKTSVPCPWQGGATAVAGRTNALCGREGSVVGLLGHLGREG